MCKLFESSAAGSGVAAVREVQTNVICSSGATAHKVICGTEDFHLNKQDKGIHVQVPDGPRRKSKFRRTLKEPVTTFIVSGIADVPCTEEGTNPPSRDEVLSSPRSSVSSTGTISSSTAALEERIRVECDVCGYTCVLHWLNDQPQCLKCQSVLKRRSSLQERRGVAASPARSFRISTTPTSSGTQTPTRPRSHSSSTNGVDTTEALRSDKRSSRELDVDACIGLDDIQTLWLSSLSSHRQTESTRKDGVRISVNGHIVFMKCIECGNQCLPHCLNDGAHCCKCQAVPTRRPNAYRTNSLSARSTRSHRRRTSTL